MENERGKCVCVKPWSQGWLIAAGAYPGYRGKCGLNLNFSLVKKSSVGRNGWN